MATSIRLGRAGDAEFLAWVMLSASRAHLRRGVWDLLIGADEAECLDYLRGLALAEPRSLCHYSSFLVADIDGVPAAALSGFEFRAGGGWGSVAQAMEAVQHDLAWTDADVAASYQRVAPVWACFLPDAGADWGIENIATRPEYRRRGLVRTLLEEALCDGRERGCKLTQIITYIGNNQAKRVYERTGFRCADEKRCPEMAAVLEAEGFIRFVRDVEPQETVRS